MWNVSSDAQKQRSPNGAGARTIDFIEGTLGPNLADYNAATEDGYRRVAYLSQLAQSEAMRTVVDGGRLGAAAASGRSGVFERPWGFMFWQLNDVTQGYSWGKQLASQSLELDTQYLNLRELGRDLAAALPPLYQYGSCNDLSGAERCTDVLDRLTGVPGTIEAHSVSIAIVVCSCAS